MLFNEDTISFTDGGTLCVSSKLNRKCWMNISREYRGDGY